MHREGNFNTREYPVDADVEGCTVDGPDAYVQQFPARRRRRVNFGDIEAALGVLVSGCLTFAIGFGGLIRLLMSLHRLSPTEKLGWTLAWLFATVGAARSIAMFARMFESEFTVEPRPIALALRQRSQNLLLRLIKSVWWLANALAVFVAAETLIHQRITSAPPRSTTRTPQFAAAPRPSQGFAPGGRMLPARRESSPAR